MKLRGPHHLLSFGLLLAAAAFPIRAHAEQFVLVDLTYEATADNTMDSHYFTDPIANTPENWRAPINFANGTAYVRFEVLTKPSAAKTLYNICFENAANYACLPYSPTYTATGVVMFNAPFSAFWQGNMMDWAMGTTRVQLILKDDKETKVQGNDDFYPTKIHTTITIVAPGSTYMPPTVVPTAGAGGAAGSGGASGRSAAGRGGTGGAAAGRGGSGGAAAGRGGAGGAAGGGGAAVAGTGGIAGEDGSGGPDEGSTAQAGSTAQPGSASTAGRPGTGTKPPAADAGASDDEETSTSPITGQTMQPDARTPPSGGLDGSCTLASPGTRAASGGETWLIVGFAAWLLRRHRRLRVGTRR